jgi:predicted secreted protein
MIRAIAVALVLLAVLALPATASAPPVGALPAGPTKAIYVKTARTFWIVLPKSTVRGRVWRLARPYDATVIRQTREGEKGNTVWVTFRTFRAGTTRVVFALTLGERQHAYAARRFAIHVSR